MLFNSWQFGVFLPIVFALYWSLPHRFRWALILIASYWFYMSWNVKYVVLILFTTGISYIAAIMLERFRNNPHAKKLILTFTLLSCLGVLFVFKYFNFFAGAVADFLQMFALHLHPSTLKLLLPVGISFYTFQTLAYVIDVYRGNTKAEHHFGIYAAFISFFPQLVAGPIERTNNLLPQIKARHDFDYGQAVYGVKLMAWGFFKKLCVADVLAVYSDRVFNDVYNYRGFALILAAGFFTFQIYCDFSGYSDIARGCAKLFGIELMENFRSPYFSASIREFW
ncbi:MAG: MBOAT family protein, partial [Synergistaceae bacterium]|nr:MBOAT family protein [Synergistaceae bacterium]